MSNQQVKQAFEHAESAGVEDLDSSNSDTIPDAVVEDYNLTNADHVRKPITRTSLFWYAAAFTVSIGLWMLIFDGTKFVLGMF